VKSIEFTLSLKLPLLKFEGLPLLLKLIAIRLVLPLEKIDGLPLLPKLIAIRLLLLLGVTKVIFVCLELFKLASKVLLILFKLSAIRKIFLLSVF
jgi:hypothetical protein